MNYLITELWPYVLGLFVFVGGILTAYTRGKSAEQDKHTKDTLKAAKQAKKEREHVENLADDDLYSEFDRLHNRKR